MIVYFRYQSKDIPLMVQIYRCIPSYRVDFDTILGTGVLDAPEIDMVIIRYFEFLPRDGFS